MIFTIIIIVVSAQIIGAVYYFSVHVKCENCWLGRTSFFDGFKRRSVCHTFRRNNWSANGWRSVSERIVSHGNNFDKSGGFSGRYESVSWANRTVPTVTQNVTDFFTCPDCHHQWTKDSEFTVDL